MKNKTITIEVYGGCVTEVTGLPDGYDYEIIDHDNDELAKTILDEKEAREAASDKQQATSSKRLNLNTI